MMEREVALVPEKMSGQALQSAPTSHRSMEKMSSQRLQSADGVFEHLP